VLLSDAEKERLTNELGQAFFDRVIVFYSAWKKEKGKISKDDNLTIRRWVIDAVKKQGPIESAPILPKPSESPKLPICPVCGTTGKMMRQSFCPKCGYLLEPACMADLEAVSEYKKEWEAKGKV
jgi:hypothetical protein